MSFLEKKLLQKTELTAFNTTSETPEGVNVPTRPHAFENWKSYINQTFRELSQHTMNRCLNQCDYDIALMGGRKTPFNDHAQYECSQDCKVRWLSPYHQSTRLADFKAQGEYERCLKGDTNVDMESQDVFECKRVMFNSYMDNMIESEQEYLRQAMSKFSN